MFLEHSFIITSKGTISYRFRSFFYLSDVLLIILYLGLFLVSKYIFPIYSPTTPKLINWIPPIKQIIQVILAQPSTVFPIKLEVIVHTTPNRLNKATNNPNETIIRRGRTLKLVIPSIARLIIFIRG